MKFTPKKSIFEEELQVPSFDSNRTYDVNDIIDLILNSFVLSDENLPKLNKLGIKYDSLYDDPESILDEICQNSFLPTWSGDNEIEADELESKLKNFAKDMEFTQAELNELCEEIKHTKNPKSARVEEFNDDLQLDISSLENIKAELNTNMAAVGIGKLINELKKFNYSGNKYDTWKYNEYKTDPTKYTLMGGSEEDYE